MAQHDQERTMRPQLHIICWTNLGMQPFSKLKVLIVRPLKITNACLKQVMELQRNQQENKAAY